MKKNVRIRLLVAMLSTCVLAPVGRTSADTLMPGSKFCDQAKPFKGIPIVVDGPSSQIPVHTRVFQPAYVRACRSGAGMVTYLGSGDRAGLEAVLDHRGNRTFGTSDVAFSTAEWLQAWFDLHASDRHNRTSIFGVHQIPLYVNVIAVGYNLPSCRVKSLNLRSQVLSLIYAGLINFWDHAALVQDNPGLATCHFPIRLIKRADVAGTTTTFKNFLGKRNPIWRHYEQPEQNVVWPSIANACPALGEDGMADCILSTQNSIGYLQFYEARVRGVRVARLDNVASGAAPPDGINIGPARTVTGSPQFVAPTPGACTEAAASAVLAPTQPREDVPVQAGGIRTYVTKRGLSHTSLDWSSVSITDAPRGYPICSFSFALTFAELLHAYSDGFDQRQARTAVDYLVTAVSDAAQAGLVTFGFGRLPPEVQRASQEGLKNIVVA